MDILFFFMVKMGFDLFGLYLIFLLGNKYIVLFIDIYFGWLEVFFVFNK